MRRIEQPLVLAEGRYTCVQTGVCLSVHTCRDQRTALGVTPQEQLALYVRQAVVVVGLLFRLFFSLEGPSPSSQINHKEMLLLLTNARPWLGLFLARFS